MVRISSFNVRQNVSIDERVQSGNVINRGAGSVAAAVGQIGAQAAVVANQFLAEEKLQESKRYNLNKSTQKDRDRDFEYNRAVSSYDPSKGTVVFKSESADGRVSEEDTGLGLHEYMDKWDKNWNDLNAADAPTTQAKRLFELQDLSSRKVMLAKANKDTLVQNQAWEVDAFSEVREETVKSLANKGKSLTRIEGENAIQKLNEAYLSADAVNTADADRKILKNSQRSVSNGWLTTQLEHDNLMQMGNVLEVDTFDLKSNDAQAKVVRDKLDGMVQTFLNDNKARVAKQVITPEGDLLVQMEDKRAIRFQNDGSVSMTDGVSEVITTPTIDVQGEVRKGPNPMKDALTEGEYLGWLSKFYNGLEAKMKQKKSQLVNEYKGLSKRLASDDPNIALNYNDPETREMVQGYTNQIVGVLGAEKATPLVTDLAGSVVIKSMQQEPFLPGQSMLSKAKNSSNNIDAVIADLGVSEAINNKNLMSGIKGNIRNRVVNWSISNASHQHKAEYVTSHDSRARQLDANKDAGATQHQDYISRLDARYDEMQIPKGKRQYYRPDYLSQEASKVNGFLARQDETGLNSAFEWGHQHRSIKGPENFKRFMDAAVNQGKMDPSVRLSLLQPNTDTGVTAGKEMMDSIINRKDIAENHKTAFPNAELKLRKEVFSKIKDMQNFLAVKTNYSGSQSEMRALNDVMLLQAQKIQLRNGTTSDSDAAGQAFDVLMKNNWTVVKEGETATVFSPMFLANAGVTPEQTKGMVDVFSKPENLVDMVKLDSIVDPTFAKTLSESDLKDRNTVNEKLRAWFLDGQHKIDIIPDGPVMRFKLRQSTGMSKGVMLLDKNGEELTIDLRDAANDPKVIESNKSTLDKLQEGSVNFFNDMVAPLR